MLRSEIQILCSIHNTVFLLLWDMSHCSLGDQSHTSTVAYMYVPVSFSSVPTDSSSQVPCAPYKAPCIGDETCVSELFLNATSSRYSTKAPILPKTKGTLSN